MSYNGWTNFETLNVILWMDNEQPQADYWAEEARKCYEEAADSVMFSRAENATFSLRDRIREEHEDAANDMLEMAHADVGPFADLLRGALSEVNWHEIAKSLIERHCDQEV